MSAKRSLTRFRAPDERTAEDRAWEVIRSAYGERRPAARRWSRRRRAGMLAVGVALIGGLALSPAGASVGRLISRALGVQPAAPALFSLPAPGRLLVSGPGGTWTVAADGSTRRVGPWPEASWSPHGLFLTVAGANRLAAIDTRGVPKWALARPQVADPTWLAPSGYRVAYLSGKDLRVVAGDGTGDHLLGGPVARVPPVWRPGNSYELAYLTARGRLVVRDGDTGLTAWSASPRVSVRELAWSADGQRLLVLSPRDVLLYDASGRLVSKLAAPAGAQIRDGALSPDGHRIALVSGGASGGVTVADVEARHPLARRVLTGSGLGQADWSPDGRWLVISWPAADQWVFVRVIGAPRISAVSRIAKQFSTGANITFPRLEGWCCSAAGTAG